MAEDKGKEEEKFDFTSDGEGYFNLDDAVLSARRLVRQDEERYLSRTGWEEIVWSTSESDAGDVSLKVILQFRKPGRDVLEKESGLEEFLFGYDGELQDRQVITWPNNPSAAPLLGSASTPRTYLAAVQTPTAVRLGAFGASHGVFDRPNGVAVAPDGSVYVADTDNHRVQKFTSDGVFVTEWSKSFKSDQGRRNLFSKGLKKWANKHGTGHGEFNQPRGVAVASDGSFYVSDASRVQRFTSEGVFVNQWEAGGYSVHHSIGVAPDGSVYCADISNHIVQKFTKEGVFVTELGTEGTGDGQFKYPAGTAVAPDGSVYVSDAYHRIQKFTSEGVFVGKWGSQGIGDGQFYYPYDLAVSSDGNVYVVDAWNNRIQKFTSEGVFISKWGTEGVNNGQFQRPEGIAVAPDGSVYVADTLNSRVQKFAPRPQQPTR